MKAVDIIPASDTWKIVDSTKLTTFMECPRSYFYEYVLGWRSIYPNLHLEFGTAWHLAMEHLLQKGYSPESIKDAYKLLEDHYRQFFSVEMDASNAPKNPSNAFMALVEYVNYWKVEDTNDKVLYTEIAGVASIAKDRLIHFRMDSILDQAKGITSREHKTASQLSRQWRDQWSLAIQVGTYLHVLYCLFPPETVWGVEINGTIFNKTKTQFERVPCRRQPSMMEVWLATVNYWVDNVEREMEFLFNECTEEDTVLRAFPQNPTSCTKYFGCKFQDYCLAWANPLQHCKEPPMDMKIEHWNPAAKESNYYFTV